MGYGLAVCKNPGGTNGLLPVVKKLRKNHQVRLLANVNAVTQLFNAHEAFEFYPSAEEVLANYPCPDFLVTSMCDADEGGIGRALIPLLRGHCPIFGLQDYWGGTLTVEWADPAYRPNYIFVNDLVGTKIVLKAWPDFTKDMVIETGFPMMDQYANIGSGDQRRARDEINAKLNVDDKTKIIFFPCGIMIGASQLLNEVLEAIKILAKTDSQKKSLRFIPRAHPRLNLIAPNESKPWDEILSQFSQEYPNMVVADQSIVRGDINWLLMASDVVISDYSTTLLQAGILGGKLAGKANISVCYLETVAKQFNEALGGLADEPPFVTLGCTLRAENLQDLADKLYLSLNSAETVTKLYSNQQKFLRADGQNAQRVADFIKNLL